MRCPRTSSLETSDRWLVVYMYAQRTPRRTHVLADLASTRRGAMDDVGGVGARLERGWA